MVLGTECNNARVLEMERRVLRVLMTVFGIECNGAQDRVQWCSGRGELMLKVLRVN